MTGKRALLGVATALAALAAAAPAGSGTDPWAALHRPLHLPKLKYGQRCPVSSAQAVAPGISVAQGPGPAYPVNTYPTMRFTLVTKPGELWYPSRWSGQKTLWIVKPHFTGRRVL